MKVVFGLGNPSSYDFTRHNVGCMAVDRISSVYRISLKRNFLFSIWGEGFIKSEKLILAKPLIFMNENGKAVAELRRYFQFNIEDLIIIHDDLDLPLGKLKIKKGGGTAGHKGLNSVVNYLSSKDFLRIRIGIGRPKSKYEVVDYVLSPFTKSQKEVIEEVLDIIPEVVEEIIINGVMKAMNKYN